VNRYTVDLDEAAHQQLDDIAAYIAERDGPASALQYTDRIHDACRELGLFPRRSKQRPDLAPGLYVTGFERRITITYTIDEAESIVWITGIYYGGQDWEARH